MPNGGNYLNGCYVYGVEKESKKVMIRPDTVVPSVLRSLPCHNRSHLLFLSTRGDRPYPMSLQNPE